MYAIRSYYAPGRRDAQHHGGNAQDAEGRRDRAGDERVEAAIGQRQPAAQALVQQVA